MFGPFRLPTVGVFFFSAWILMVFWGMVAAPIGVVTIGYPRAMLVTIGLWLVLFPITWVRSDARSQFWVHRRRGGTVYSGFSGNDIEISAVLGGASRRVSSSAFRGGNVHAFMGGAEIDLRGAKIAEPPAVLNVNAVLGGVEIRVPSEWRIEFNTSGMLGGSGDERRNAETWGEGQPDLVINGNFFLGGVTIKN